MLTATYNYWLVLISVVIATVDSYVSLSVSGRLARSHGAEAIGWIVLAGLAMGSGVWAMHFIGMLALDVGTPLGFDLWTTMLSVVPIVIAAGAVSRLITRPRVTALRVLGCGVLIGSGVCAMHYIGMAAMRMDPPIIWDHTRIVLSVILAIGGSAAALGVAVRTRSERRFRQRLALRWLAAIVMGCTVAALHYYAMTAAGLAVGARCLSATSILHGNGLGLVIAFLSLSVLAFTLVVSIVHQQVLRRQKRMDAALERAQNALTYQAFHDALTGLPNRTYLVNALRKQLAESHDNLAVLFVDLDGFKTINDSLGHHAGDEFLRSVARAMRASVRDRDIVARFGGDEFVIVLRAYGGPDNLIAICEKILELVSRPVQVSSHTVTVTPSIGIAIAPADGDDADTLLRNADAAMYTVKEFGKFGFRFFERSMHTIAHERLTLSQELREALHIGAIEVHYQPQKHLRTGSLAGLEALARWNHPTRGTISPTVFVPISERSGLVASLGTHVLRTVIEHLKGWSRAGFEPPYVAINLSPQELRDPSFADSVHEAIVFHGIAPSRIRFEITESTATRHPEITLRLLRLLEQKGFELAIDDFGTGYSSLSYLRQMPTRTVKIDQSFIRGSTQNRADREITEAIVALAKKLHLETVAEGVELEEEANWLRDMGCDVGQGFYFARPMPADELLMRFRVASATIRTRTQDEAEPL